MAWIRIRHICDCRARQSVPCLNCEIGGYQEKIQKLQDEVNVLAAQKGLLEEENKELRDFIQHKDSCAIGEFNLDAECTCGFDKFLSETQEKK